MMAAEPRLDPMEVEVGAGALTNVSRTHQSLNRELLSWATHALEAVFSTPECQKNDSARYNIRAALLSLDELDHPLYLREALDHG